MFPPLFLPRFENHPVEQRSLGAVAATPGQDGAGATTGGAAKVASRGGNSGSGGLPDARLEARWFGSGFI